MNLHRSVFDRRRMLLGTTALAGTAVVGCGDSAESESNSEPTAPKRTVPLRVLLAGSDQDAEAIRRGWGAVSEQPLAIEPVTLSHGSINEVASEFLDAALKCDVLIYPLIMLAELDASDCITSLSDEEMSEDRAKGELHASLRSGAASYSGKNIGIPLGAPLPALISGQDLPEGVLGDSLNWKTYDELVSNNWQGKACEPTAPGWAAAMFLWRASGIPAWLFDRETFEPLIATAPYVQVLRQMRTTYDRYSLKDQDPNAIWTAVSNGDLNGGIGFPTIRGSAESEPSVIQTLPGTVKNARLLLGPFSKIVSLSINCRQSLAAKQFIQWISSGEGSAATRSQVAGMTNTRIQMSQNDSSSGAGNTPAYDRWLADRLSTPVTLPNVNIRQGTFYYQVLDEKVRSVLQGSSDPTTALKEVADIWSDKTREIGRDAQLRSWRRNQGMRG
ncbi:MAG: hypothetical protein AAGG48_04060 [Planctomycetota bacterium]